MKRAGFPAIWAVLLTAAAVLSLLSGRAYIRTGSEEDNWWTLPWVVLLVLGAASLLWAYFADRRRWWWTPSAAALCTGLGLTIGLDILGAGEPWTPVVWLASILLAAAYLLYRLVVSLRLARRR